MKKCDKCNEEAEATFEANSWLGTKRNINSFDLCENHINRLAEFLRGKEKLKPKRGRKDEF